MLLNRLMLFTVILILISATVTQADPRTAVLDDEIKLDKPLTLSLRAVSLKELLAEIENKTVVRLVVAPEVAQDKATVWVKDRSAREVLCAIAHCFNLCWTVSEYEGGKKFYHLRIDRTYLAEQHHREYEDYKAIVGQWDEELKKTAELVRASSPFEPAEELMNKLSKEDIVQYHRFDRRRAATHYPKLGTAVLHFLALSDRQKESLIGGSHVIVSEAGAIPAPDSEADTYNFWVERSLSGYMVRYAIRPGAPVAHILSSAYFDYSKYRQSAETSGNELLKDKFFDKKLQLPETSVALQLGNGSGMVPATMSDDLLRLIEQSETPFVAQYISEYFSPGIDMEKGLLHVPGSGAKTVGERLAELCKQHMFTVQRDGDFLLAKNLLWHRMRNREVPEESIKRWQRQFCGLPLATFDAYVDMAKMNWDQIRGTIANRTYWFETQSLLELAKCEYGLKIYGALSREQQSLLHIGIPISVVTLTPQQQRVFMQGFEVSEQPTYALAGDDSWPSTATFSMTGGMLTDDSVVAVANMRMLATEMINSGEQVDSTRRPSEEEMKLLYQKREAELPKIVKLLANRVAKEHPEIRSRDVAIYCVRTTQFKLRLGKDERKLSLTYFAKVK